jgi:CheY-like chemotaxis protein
VKVLVVDPDSRRAPQLQDTLMAGGAEVTVASSGSFALTMLEWNRHDVVVSRAQIDDMAGHELCAILKADPGTREVRFVLVAGPEEVTPTETAAAGVDLVLPPSMTGGAILPLIVRLMEANRPSGSEPTAPATPPTPAAAAPPVAAGPPAASAPAAVAPASASPAVPAVLPPREAAMPPPATGVPRIRPEAAPPLRVEPPKRYATTATDTTGPWSNTPGKAAPAAPAAASPGPALRPTPPAPAGRRCPPAPRCRRRSRTCWRCRAGRSRAHWK